MVHIMMHSYQELFSVEGYFTEDINGLNIPDYVRSGICAQPPNITVYTEL